MDSRTEKKIEKELDRADRQHDKATIADAKGHTHGAARHEKSAMKHEHKAEALAHNVVGGAMPAGGIAPYTGLNFPYSGTTAHPQYGYHRLPRDKKAERFELKAMEWEKRGNLGKAQKNREKAQRHRSRMMPGYTAPVQPQQYYIDKANRLEQRAFRYQQLGMVPQSQRYQQRAQRIRTKHRLTGAPGIIAPGMAGANQFSHIPATGQHFNNGAYIGPIVPMGTVYKGLNYPYTGATQHPTFGYSRLSSAQKAQRFDAKAADWERRGDMVKAQKNRDKANRYRQMGQAGYAKPTRAQDYYVNRASNYDQKAIRYQQMGQSQKAARAQQRAQRIRAKHNITAPMAGAGLAGAGLGGAALGANRGMGGQYQGLNFPYTGASNHPTYGYQRLGRDQKIQRWEQKAAEWDRRGNTAKAQKNREKAARYRQMSQPGYVRPVRDNNYYNNRANLFDQKARQYQQWGMMPQYQRYQGRSQRIRAKHNIPMAAGVGAAGYGAGMGTRSTPYSGLNFPYNGAAAHPTYGYQRLPHNKKAERFELKAAEWEKRGNMAKAQKNREKAQRYRARSAPGYAKPSRQQNHYNEKAMRLDQKAAQYMAWGQPAKAQRYQGRAQRIRAKHPNVMPIGAYGLGSGIGSGIGTHAHGQTWTTGQTVVGPLVPAGTHYSGLNYPYAGAATHPTYGYQRLPHNKKAERFELKAAEWERRGNMAKAQKNREKALRYRQRGQPGYVAPVRDTTYYTNRANLYDQKALQYQQWGMMPQAQRYQGRSRRLRSKHNIPMAAVGTGVPSTYAMRPSYTGLAIPYSGAVAHPAYGYQRLPRDKKAERFELKAAEWERRGNLAKAQKNREKAQRHRARTQPGYVAPVRPQTYYVDRANLFDQKALQYQQWGMLPQAQRYQGRSRRLRTKHNLPVATQPLYTTATPVVPVTTARVI